MLATNRPDQVLHTEEIRNGLRLETVYGEVTLAFVHEGIVGVRYHWKDEAELALDTTAVVLTNEPGRLRFVGAEATLAPVIELERGEPGANQPLTLSSSELELTVEQDDFALSIRSADGEPLYRDLRRRALRRDRLGRRFHRFEQGGWQSIYGGGQSPGQLDKRGTRLRFDARDALGYDTATTSPLYIDVPFLLLRDEQNRSLGLFYDHAGPAACDLGTERNGYWPPFYNYEQDEGDLVYYLIAGASPAEIVSRYTLLTGRGALPRVSTLGYWASTMFFTELPQSDHLITEFVRACREYGFGIDGFHLSSGYTSQDGLRYVFTWNKDRFPDPNAFVAGLADMAVSVSPNIKPALLLSHPLYDEFADKGAFLKDEETGEPALYKYWGGQASFVDFTSEAGRELWIEHATRALLDYGIDSLWNDNNEYDLGESNALADNGGEPVSSQILRGSQANLMALSGREALIRKEPGRRPYILTRSGFAGIQRYAQTWTGDNDTSWETLRGNIPMMLNLGLSGIANTGSDIGGFAGHAPSAELFVRWVQNGIWHPRFCIHSANSDNTVLQPWSYAEANPLIMRAFKLRYRLALYYYSLLYEAHETGAPVLRPLFYEFPEDEGCRSTDDVFMAGRALLVATVLEEGAELRRVRFPAGCGWVDPYTGTVYEGGRTCDLPVSRESIPFFQRQGSIVPLILARQNLETRNSRDIELSVEASLPAETTLYLDDGESLDPDEAGLDKVRVTARTSPRGILIGLEQSNPASSYAPQHLKFRVLRPRVSPFAVIVNGQPLPGFLAEKSYLAADLGWYFDMTTRTLWVTIRHIERHMQAQDGRLELLIDMAPRDIARMDG